MSGGFNNPIIGGGGNLVYPSIQSPNFSLAGQTGWAILKNGNAFFFNITAEGTITATTFLGTDFVINSAGEFFYSGAPASGNLGIAIAIPGGSDSFGNAYPEGVTVFLPVSAGALSGTYAVQLGNFTNAGGAGSGNAALTLGNVTSPPHLPPGVISQNDSSQASISLNSGNATPGTANSQVTVFDSTFGPGGLVGFFAGKVQFTSAIDNNVYNVGRIVKTTAAPFNVTGTSNLFTWQVAAGTYEVDAEFVIQNIAVTAVLPFGYTGPAVTNPNRYNITIMDLAASSPAVQTVRLNTLSSVTLTTAHNFRVTIHGVFDFTSGGTLAFQVGVAAAPDTWTLEDGAIFGLRPVS